MSQPNTTQELTDQAGMSAPVDVLADLRKIADGEGDAELLAMRAHAAIAELIDAAREDGEMPVEVVLSYFHDGRKEGEPDTPEWWTFKRKELEGRGYTYIFEQANGSEVFVKNGQTERLCAALRAVGGAE